MVSRYPERQIGGLWGPSSSDEAVRRSGADSSAAGGRRLVHAPGRPRLRYVPEGDCTHSMGGWEPLQGGGLRGESERV